MSEAVEEELDLMQSLPWIEFCAWSGVVMTPIIWWLQGPSVSDDQFIVRTAMVTLSVIVAVSLRLWAIFAKRVIIEHSPGQIGPSQASEPGRFNGSSEGQN